MSLSGASTVIQVNGANFTVADATKELRSNLIRFGTTSEGLFLSSLNGNVYTSSNIKAGYYHGNAKHLVSISDAAAGTYGGADAVVASVVVDSTGRITGISNVNIELDDVLKHGNTTSNTVQFTNAGVSLKATGEINAGSFVGDGTAITDTTSAAQGTYGDVNSIPIITVDADRRISSISTTPANRDTFSNVVARGASTANVVTFSNNGNAILVTHANGKIGIANSLPGHALSIGKKFYVDKGATSTNVAVVHGNVAATYYYGNAKHLTNTTDITGTTSIGDDENIPTINFENGRIVSVSNNPISINLEGVTAKGNTTTHKVTFDNSDVSLIASGKVGIANTAPDHSLAVADNFYVGSDGATVASYFSGDGANVINIVGSSTVKGVTHGGSTSVPTIQIDSDGKITQIANTTIAQTLQAVTENGAISNQTVTLENATSLQAQGKVAVSTSSAPTHDFHVGSNVYVDDDGANKVVVTGRVSATDYIGDAGFLSNVSDVKSISHGATNKVPIITFDSNGRIETVSNIDVQSNVISVSGAGDNAGKFISYYSDDNTVTSSSGATFDPSTGNMEISGAFTAGGDLQVGGNLHVTGNVYHSENLVVDDNLIEIGNAAATSKTLGTLLSRSDGNVAIAYLNTDHASYANTLIFAKTDASGASSVIDPLTAHLDAKFFGNLTVQNNFTIGSSSKFFFDTDNQNLTVGGVITATTFDGSGAALSSIQASNISDNVLSDLTQAKLDISDNSSRITTLDTKLNTEVSTNIAPLIVNLSDNSSRISTLNTKLDTEVSTNIAPLIVNLSDNSSRISTLNTKLNTEVSTNIAPLITNLSDNSSRISTLQTKTTDISFSGSTTTVEHDLVIGSAAQFFFDESTSKLGISNSSAPHALTVGDKFYVDTTYDVVSTIGSTLNTGTVEVVGDLSTVDFKTDTGENADCRIEKSNNGLVLSTGGNGSLTTAMTLYANTDADFNRNISIGGELNVANLVTSNIVFSSNATIQAAQISLDDVVAVSGTTDKDITVRDLTAVDIVSTTLSVSSTKNFNIPHPVVEGKRLIHACIETARADNVYMGEVVLDGGRAEVDLDAVNGMTSGTFVALNKDIRVFTTNESDWDAVKGSVDGSTLRIACQNGDSGAKVSWLVAGTRTDIPDLVVEV